MSTLPTSDVSGPSAAEVRRLMALVVEKWNPHDDSNAIGLRFQTRSGTGIKCVMAFLPQDPLRVGAGCGGPIWLVDWEGRPRDEEKRVLLATVFDRASSEKRDVGFAEAAPLEIIEAGRTQATQYRVELTSAAQPLGAVHAAVPSVFAA